MQIRDGCKKLDDKLFMQIIDMGYGGYTQSFVKTAQSKNAQLR